MLCCAGSTLAIEVSTVNRARQPFTRSVKGSEGTSEGEAGPGYRTRHHRRILEFLHQLPAASMVSVIFAW